MDNFLKFNIRRTLIIAILGSVIIGLVIAGMAIAGTIITTDSLNKGLVGHWDLKSTSEKVGSEMWDSAASTFESGTYSWQTWGITTIDNVGNALEITYGDGTLGAYNYLTDNKDLNTNLTVGKRYRLVFDAKSVGGSATAYGDIEVPPDPHVTTSTLTNTMKTYALDFTATSTTSNYFSFRGLTVGNVITVDNISLKPLNTADSTPNTNHGTIYGASYTTDRHGQANKAMNFDGTDDYIDLANAISFGTGDFTIAGWVNASASEGGYGVLIGDLSSGSLNFYATNGTITNSPRVELTACPTNYLYGGMDIRGAWHHIAVTRSGGTIKLWVDTIVKDTDTCAGDTYMNNPRIGEATHVTTEGFYGSISNIKIYNRALSKQEIIQLYESYN